MYVIFAYVVSIVPTFFRKFRIHSTKVIAESWFVRENVHTQISQTNSYVCTLRERDPLFFIKIKKK